MFVKFTSTPSSKDNYINNGVTTIVLYSLFITVKKQKIERA